MKHVIIVYACTIPIPFLIPDRKIILKSAYVSKFNICIKLVSGNMAGKVNNDDFSDPSFPLGIYLNMFHKTRG